MLTPDWFINKRVTVMGLGVHGGGLGAAAWLVKHGARVTVTDLRDAQVLAKSVAALERVVALEARRQGSVRVKNIRYVLGRHDEADFSNADMVVRNPAVPREHPLLALAEKQHVRVESDISIFFLLCPFPIAAVSGTKGKTTTTALLAAICKARDARTVIGGNIRVSPLDALDRLIALAAKKTAVPPPIVLELSSWQLESLERHRISPHVAVLTNVLEDHLNRYSGIDDYARAKEIILAFQQVGDIAVVNADESRVAAMGRKRSAIIGSTHGGRRLWFSMKPLPKGKDGCFVRGTSVVLRIAGEELVAFSLSSVKLPGAHNIGNVLAATAAARSMGVPIGVIRRIVRGFGPVPGRLEDVATKRGVRYINDTTATAPDASIAAMETFGGGTKKRIILISGGADKELRFDAWARKVKSTVKHLVLFTGSATPKMEAALAHARVRVPTSNVLSMREAVEEARRHAGKGDIVLLSPGCASFGVFQNEFDRGDQFTAWVKRLIRGQKV